MRWRNLLSTRKIVQAVRIETSALRKIMFHGKPDVILHFLGGIGDELSLTCIARELRKRDPRLRIWQISGAAPLLRENSDYALVMGNEAWSLRHSNVLMPWRHCMSYSEQPLPGVYEVPPREHVLAIMCRKAGLRGRVDLRPWYSQTPAEAREGRLSERQIAIQSVGERTHETWMPNKNWFHDRFQQVVSELKRTYPKHLIIQLGVAGDRSLDDVQDMRSKTSLRQSAAILSQSECFIGTSGFLSHLARAVELRSVIIYGGKEHAWQFGYVCNENLETHLPCSPCGLWKDCDNERKCMRMIVACDVVKAVERVLEKRGQSLEVQEVELSDYGDPIPPTYPTVPGWHGIAQLPPFVG